MISCHLRAIGGYLVMVGYICYRRKEPCNDVIRGGAESMYRLTHVIPSVPIKDRIVGGPLVILNTYLSLSWPDNSFQPRSQVAQLRSGPIL